MVGIGVIEGPYEYYGDRSEFWHVRKTRWIVSTALTFDRPIFRFDTFAPTLKWALIRERVLENHPELAAELEQIEKHRPAVQQQRYWWLNANPRVWRIDDWKLGERQTYTVLNEKGNKRRRFEYFQQVQPGDQVIGYQSSPIQKITALQAQSTG